MSSVGITVPYETSEQRMAAEEIRKRLSAEGLDASIEPHLTVGDTDADILVFGGDLETVNRALEGSQLPPGTQVRQLG